MFMSAQDSNIFWFENKYRNLYAMKGTMKVWCVKIIGVWRSHAHMWCTRVTHTHTHPWNSPPTTGLGCLSIGPFPATGVFFLCSRSCLWRSLLFFLLPDLSDCSHLVLVIRMSLQDLLHSAGMWLRRTSIWLLPLSPLLVGIPKVSLAWCVALSNPNFAFHRCCISFILGWSKY